MIGLLRIRIARHERGLLMQGPDYSGCLRPGVHWIWGFGKQVERVSTRDLTLSRDDLPVLLRDPELWEDLEVVDLAQDQRALVWVDGRLEDVLTPERGRVAYWKDLREVRVETFDATELRFVHRALDAILASRAGGAALLQVLVAPGHRALLFVDGELRETLTPGRYAFWRGASQLQVTQVDLRRQGLDVSGQEILTRDKVSLRLNLDATFRVRDPVEALEQTGDVRTALYRALQLALREAVGARTLDELLAAKAALGEEIQAAVAPQAAQLGAELDGVGIRDVILPGEMKVLLNRVIEAEKRAQATTIERKEETASTRSLLNTARLIEQSPTLLRLKELESAERMAASIDQVQILGGGVDALLGQLLPKRDD